MRDRQILALAAAFLESLPVPVMERQASWHAAGCGLFLGAAASHPAARAAWERLAPALAPGEERVAVLISPRGQALGLTTRALLGHEAHALDDLQVLPPLPDWHNYDPESRALFRELVEILAMPLPFRLPE